jgi:serine/threonine protein kinase
MLTFTCSRCGQLLRVPSEFAGKKARCQTCGGITDIPPVPAEAAALGATQPHTFSPAPEDAGVQTFLPPGGTRPAEGNGPPRPAPLPVELPPDLLAPPQGPDELGRLGPYRVLRVLGVGGMGIVFHAEDTRLKRPVALKAMLPVLAASASARERFLREAQAAAAIDHDHIVTIYQVDEDRGVPFLAMQLLQGETLESRLRREKRLPPAAVVHIGRDVAEGLAAAHERGLIHRDVKPANIWLEARGDGRPTCRPSGAEATGGPPRVVAAGGPPAAEKATGGPPVATEFRVKLLDFGLARAASDDTRLTQPGALVGTPAYMAPEQARGQPVDARSDLFSLGCVLYRCCTGELPFKGVDTLSILTALATQTPRPVDELNPAVPPPLSDLVMRLLAKEPAGRPASARAVADTLAALDGGPVQRLPDRPAAADDTEPLLLSEYSGESLEVPRPRRTGLLVLALVGAAALLGLFSVCLAGAGWWFLHGRVRGPLALGKKPERWTVLFRSDDPAVWDTDSPGERFAIPLKRAPEDIRYLRLRRMDTEEFLIVPISYNLLDSAAKGSRQTHWWNGTNKNEHGGRHLGIAEEPLKKFPFNTNLISVMNSPEEVGWHVYTGSGFGHKCQHDAEGQCYCWRGAQIPKTVFEVAVTAEPLTPEEQRWLLQDK